MRYLGLPLLLALLPLGGCISQHAVRVDPIQLQPIHVTMDVNVRVQDQTADAATPEPTEPRTAPPSQESAQSAEAH